MFQPLTTYLDSCFCTNLDFSVTAMRPSLIGRLYSACSALLYDFCASYRRQKLGGWSAPHLSSEGEGPASPAPAAAARTQTRPRRPRTFPWGCALRNRCSGSRRPAPRQPPRAERPPWQRHSWRRDDGGRPWLLRAARQPPRAERPPWQKHS